MLAASSGCLLTQGPHRADVSRATGTETHGAPGVSGVPVTSAAAGADQPNPIDCTHPPLPSLASSSRAALLPVRSGFVSMGHAGGQYTATVRANSQAAASQAAPGALWIAELRRNSDRTEGPVLAMERRMDPKNPSRAGWCYVVAEHDGTVLRAGALSDCSGCHAAAPTGVFTTVGP